MAFNKINKNPITLLSQKLTMFCFKDFYIVIWWKLCFYWRAVLLWSCYIIYPVLATFSPQRLNTVAGLFLECPSDRGSSPPRGPFSEHLNFPEAKYAADDQQVKARRRRIRRWAYILYEIRSFDRPRSAVCSIPVCHVRRTVSSYFGQQLRSDGWPLIVWISWAEAEC